MLLFLFVCLSLAPASSLALRKEQAEKPEEGVPAVDSILDLDFLRSHEMIVLSSQERGQHIREDPRLHGSDQKYPSTRVSVEEAQNLVLTKASCADPSTKLHLSHRLAKRPFLFVVESGATERALQVFSASIYNCSRNEMKFGFGTFARDWVEFDLGAYDLKNVFLYLGQGPNATLLGGRVFSDPRARRHPSVGVLAMKRGNLQIINFDWNRNKIKQKSATNYVNLRGEMVINKTKYLKVIALFAN